MKGTQIEIEGAGHDEVKLLLHKFLHHRGLRTYKVHSQPGFIEIVPHDAGEDRKESKGRSPTAPETMPYFFPGRATGERSRRIPMMRSKIPVFLLQVFLVATSLDERSRT